MLLHCIFGLIVILKTSEAQLTARPAVTTNSACLNECLENWSVVFAAKDLRNFESIIVNIEQFCHANEELQKCASKCTSEDQANLAQRTDLSLFICEQKIEEFRLVKECIESHDVQSVNQCASDCGLSTDSAIQLDSSPSAIVNPFSFFDSITPVCRSLECTLKCSIAETNNKCAGAGDIFKDIGHRQVAVANKRLSNDMNSTNTNVAGELARIYLEALPEQCSYVVDPEKYDTLFTPHEETGSEVVTEVASVDDGFIVPFTETSISPDNRNNAEVGRSNENSDSIFVHQSDGKAGEMPKFSNFEPDSLSSVSPRFSMMMITSSGNEDDDIEPKTTTTMASVNVEPNDHIPQLPFGPVSGDQEHKTVGNKETTRVPSNEDDHDDDIISHHEEMTFGPVVFVKSDITNGDLNPNITPEPTIITSQENTVDVVTEDVPRTGSEEKKKEENKTKEESVERTILVVNDDGEIERNEVKPEPAVPPLHKKNGVHRLTTLSVAILLPLALI